METSYTPGEWTKARIIKCTNKDHWHVDKIGQVIKLRDPGWNSAFYESKTGESIPKGDVSEIIPLTERQKSALRILRKYPSDIVMHDGWLTGGYGIRIDRTTVRALRKKGLLDTHNRINILGKKCDL